MATVYYDSDADLSLIQGRKIAVLGYGSQGHAHALSLRDSGCEVRVGLPEGSKSRPKAEAEGLTVTDPADACAWADVIMVLTPDTGQRKLYADAIAPNLRPGDALFFAHGFNIHFGYITPPPEVDVAMVAPKAPGHLVRRQFEAGQGTPVLVAVAQDATGLVNAGFETLVDAGYQPEVAYFECLHELKLIVDLMYEGGMRWMRYSVSDTAEYGDLTRGDRVIAGPTREAMAKILADIQSGDFAREWIAEDDAGRPNFERLRAAAASSRVETVGRPLRQMMSWLDAPTDREEV